MKQRRFRIPAPPGWLLRNPYSARFLRDPVYREKSLLTVGLSLNALYAAFRMITGFFYHAFWLNTEAAYYLILLAVRIVLVRMETGRRNRPKAWRTYRTCGFLLILLNFAVMGLAMQIVTQKRRYPYGGLVLYASAAYTFYRMAVTAIQLIRLHAEPAPLRSAARALNLSASLVSVLALQTALLDTFSRNRALNAFLNLLTGGLVCLTSGGLGIYMVLRARKMLRRF